jgi:hypothetical protein
MSGLLIISGNFYKSHHNLVVLATPAGTFTPFLLRSPKG